MDAKVDPRKCTVDLSRFGEEHNTPGMSSFSFTARDKNGQPVVSNTVFGSKVVHNEEGVETEVHIEDVGGGNYRANFPVLKHGVYLVVLGVSSASKAIIQDMVKGSPFTVRVGPDPEVQKRVFPDTSKCYVYGPGATRSVVKRKSTFTIQACGADGSKIKNGDDTFKVKITPPAGTSKLSHLPANLIDQKDGTYVVTYSPASVGEHIVHVTESEHDRHIPGSPFSIFATDSTPQGEEVDVNATSINFKMSSALAVGHSSFAFPITTKSLSGGRLTLSITFKVKVTAPTGLVIHSRISELEDGSFYVVFVPKQSGRHEFEVEVCSNGVDYAPVKGSPAAVELDLLTDEDCVISAANVLAVSPIEKREQESPKLVPKPTPAVKPDLASISSPNLHPTVKPALPQNASLNQVRPPPKNPSVGASSRRTFSSPPPVSPPMASQTPPKVPPKNPTGSSLGNPAWLVKKS